MRRHLPIIGLLIILLVITIVHALTLSTPSWDPGAPFTNNTLNCSWTFSGDTTAQNITILRDGSLFNNTYEPSATSTSIIVHPVNTTKGEDWTCEITLFNGTASTTKSKQVTISNSPPTTEGAGAGVFNGSTDIGFIVNVHEEQTLSLDVNATDADGDTLTYLLVDSFCTRTSSTEGTYTCTPQFENTTNSYVNITFTVTDGQNVGGRTILFNVSPINDRPTASPIGQQTDVNVSLNYTFAASDVEANYPLVFNISADAEILDKLTITPLNVNGTSVSIYYDASTPDFNDVGTYNVSVNITDSDNGKYIANYTFNISGVGRRPYFTEITPSSPYISQQGTFIQINISANDLDANESITFLDNTNRFNISIINPWTNTTNATAQINFTPTNDDVGNYTVAITLQDSQLLENTTILVFNISNLNDAPVVQEISNSASNTQNNTNISNLTGYANTAFIYDVNATDIDDIYGDSLNYTDNTTLFDIDLNTGRISFTPTPAQVVVNPYHINITATDDDGLTSSRTLYIMINNNTPPLFNVSTPLSELGCLTDVQCAFSLATVAADPDAGDSVTVYNVAFISGSMSNFSYNTTTGLIDFYPRKADVGNYTVNVTIEDQFGATNNTLMNISVNNTPSAPILTRYSTMASETVVETFLFTYQFQATDQDFLVPNGTEQVNFTTNLSLSHSIIPQARVNITANGLFAFTPADGTAGNYSVEINATDRYGNVDTEVVNLEILPDVPPPTIANITPWGRPAAYVIETSYNATSHSEFQDGVADVNFNESTNVTFGVVVNTSRPQGVLTYNWSVDGVQNTTANNFTGVFEYFSAGDHIISVNVSDDRFNSVLFRWNITIYNINRAPQLVSNLPNVTGVNGTLQNTNYFTLGNGARFYDPDDDTDLDGEVSGSETNRLTFTQVLACSVATLVIDGVNLSVTGTAVGSCLVRFNATDTGNLKITSNSVVINVTDVPEGSQETTTTTSSGGGGSSSSSSTYVPIIRDEVTPKAFNLIAPRLVTIYKNSSISIPVTINNTWDGPLKEVILTAETNASQVKTSFNIDYFEFIPEGEQEEVILTVSDYRLGENYEVIVRANVSSPEFDDEALILLNSIEQASEGDELDVRVTFANDLLNEHPECQELNEVLEQAKESLAMNNYAEARHLMNTVISGCKYLVSTEQRTLEQPSKINPIITIDDLSVKTLMWSALIFIVILSTAMLIYYHFTNKGDEDF